MNCDDITLLLPDFESGSLSAADMRRVREHLAMCPACTEELALQRQLDLAIKQEHAPEPGAHMHASFRAWLETEARANPAPLAGRQTIIRVSFWNHPATVSGVVAIAACAVFACGLIVGSRTGAASREQLASQQHAVELAMLREQVDSMRQTVSWSVLQQPDAGDRLRTVRALAAADDGPAGVIQLLSVLAFDDNGQVRECAVQALHRYADRPSVRTAVARALVRETSPTVQLAMIDLLATTRDAESTTALETLVRNENQNPFVREAATCVLTRM
jgi:hypothetical protein